MLSKDGAVELRTRVSRASWCVCVCRCGSGEVPKLRLRAQGEAMMTVLSEEAILDERYGS